MNYPLVKEVVNHSPSKYAARLVMLALAENANENRQVSPSIEMVAEWTNLSERAVQYALRSLEERGEIHTQRQAGLYRCNVFTINRYTATPAPPSTKYTRPALRKAGN